MTFIWTAARVALAAVVFAFTGAAHGTIVYDLGYDPTGFFGNGQLTIDDGCVADDGTFLSNSDNCPINLVFVNAHDSGGGNWSSGPLFDIAEGMLFDVVGHNLVAFDSIPIFLNFDFFDSGRPTGIRAVGGCEASGELQFFRGDNVVTFQGCAGNESGVYSLVRAAPEPASTGLVLGAMGAAWLARRRRRSA